MHSIALEVQKPPPSTKLKDILPMDKLAEVRKTQEDLSFNQVMRIEKNIGKWELRLNAIEKRKHLELVKSSQRQTAQHYRSWYLRQKRKVDNVVRNKELLGDVMKREIQREERLAQRPVRERGFKEQHVLHDF